MGVRIMKRRRSSSDSLEFPGVINNFKLTVEDTALSDPILKLTLVVHICVVFCNAFESIGLWFSCLFHLRVFQMWSHLAVLSAFSVVAVEH